MLKQGCRMVFLLPPCLWKSWESRGMWGQPANIQTAKLGERMKVHHLQNIPVSPTSQLWVCLRLTYSKLMKWVLFAKWLRIKSSEEQSRSSSFLSLHSSVCVISNILFSIPCIQQCSMTFLGIVFTADGEVLESNSLMFFSLYPNSKQDYVNQP